MSRPTMAGILSFIIPGAGLWYLGDHRRATKNLLLAVLLTTLGVSSAWEHVHYLFLAIAAGSAGYAHAVARAMQRDHAVTNAPDDGP
ncbi:MAG: hypothetical protein R3C59_27685 [Planctomycetaceae bacterium]